MIDVRNCDLGDGGGGEEEVLRLHLDLQVPVTKDLAFRWRSEYIQPYIYIYGRGFVRGWERLLKHVSGTYMCCSEI